MTKFHLFSSVAIIITQAKRGVEETRKQADQSELALDDYIKKVFKEDFADFFPVYRFSFAGPMFLLTPCKTCYLT